MSRDKDNKETRIYVGNLPPDIRTKDIEDLFHKYGKIVFLDLKNRKGPPFAFLEFEDARFVFNKCPIFATFNAFFDIFNCIFDIITPSGPNLLTLWHYLRLNAT